MFSLYSNYTCVCTHTHPTQISTLNDALILLNPTFCLSFSLSYPLSLSLSPLLSLPIVTCGSDAYIACDSEYLYCIQNNKTRRASCVSSCFGVNGYCEDDQVCTTTITEEGSTSLQCQDLNGNRTLLYVHLLMIETMHENKYYMNQAMNGACGFCGKG